MSEASDRLRGLLTRLETYKILSWSRSSKDMPTVNPQDRERAGLADADVVASRYIRASFNGKKHNHALVIDVDHPTWLVKSSTPGHYHLYIDPPGGIPDAAYWNLIDALHRAGIIEEGYRNASLERGFTCVRLPWIKKEGTT